MSERHLLLLQCSPRQEPPDRAQIDVGPQDSEIKRRHQHRRELGCGLFYKCNQEKGMLDAAEFKAIVLMRAYKAVKPKPHPKPAHAELTLEDCDFLYKIGVAAI